MNLTPLALLWGVLTAVVLILAAMRGKLARNENDTLHVSVADKAVEEQVVLATKLEKIEKWGKLLTIIAVAYGVLLGAAYLWQFWNSSAISRG